MNREQRRNLAKKTGVSQKIVNAFFGHNKPDSPVLCKGQKVRLNYERIAGEVDYARKTDLYKAFVEAHKDDVFTVKYDKRHKDGIMVLFKEAPEWLWHSSDLVVVE